jgi:hypothetical protein
MKKKLLPFLFAAYTLCGCITAHAEFVDERSPAKPLAAASSAVAVKTAEVAAAAKPAESWVLHANRPISAQVAEWAKRAGWTLTWQFEKSWRPPADATFTGSFEKALEEVIAGLFLEGKPVHLRIWDGNRVAEVVQSTPE